MVFMGITFGNIISFNKRIDFSRMQHSKASFKNSFLYLHKYLEMFIQIIIAVVGISIIISASGDNVILQEYGLFIFFTTALVLASFNTLKMLKDETRSYFIFKRDLSRIGLKLFVVIVPLIAFHHVYKGGASELMKESLFPKNQIVKDIKDKVRRIDNLSNREFVLLLIGKNEAKIKKYLDTTSEIPWDIDVMGNYPIHLAVIAGDTSIVKLLLEKKPDILEKKGKNKNGTAIFTAINRCDLDMLEFLLSYSPNINHTNIKGNTAIIFAAQRKCYGGVVLLNKRGADLLVKNKDGYGLLDYIRDSSGIPYLLKDQLALQEKSKTVESNRLPASNSSSEVSEEGIDKRLKE